MVIRLLIVLADTEPSELNNSAVALHRGLHRVGLEVRTVALAPGSHGGFDEVVPVLAPTTRSLASVMQLRREERWADAIICAGPTTTLIQRMAGSRKKHAVFQLDHDPARPADAEPGSVADRTAVGQRGPGPTHRRGLLASFAASGLRDAPTGADPQSWRACLLAAMASGSLDTRDG